MGSTESRRLDIELKTNKNREQGIEDVSVTNVSHW